MKRLLLFVLLLAGRCLARDPGPENQDTITTNESRTASGVRVVFGVSPYLPTESKDPVFRQLVRFLLEDAPAGSSVGFVDGYDVRTITSIDIPRNQAFTSPKTRATQFRQAIQELRRFLASPSVSSNHAGVDLTAALRLPRFLEFVGRHLAEPGRITLALGVGSPLHVDVKEPGFSMVRGYFPSDGHLLATPDGSIYGLSGREQHLDGVALHLVWPGDPWINELHREKITRFWTLFAQRQGGRLGTMTGDLPTVFAALRESATSASLPPPIEVQPSVDPTRTKIEMLRITRDIDASDWIARDRLVDPARTAPNRTRGPMKIGIRWKGDLDLDLYASPAPGRDRLYFEHPRIPEGYYFKDHRSSPDREYEFVEFLVDVDVREVVAAINFYEGSVDGGPDGEVRIEFDGRIYSERFSIGNTRGNQGREGPSQAGSWYPIDIPRLLKLD